MITLPPDVVEALRKGNKIEAIKRLREATKLGLAEAKGAVEQFEQRGKASSSHASHHSPHHAHNPPLPHRPGNLSPGEMPRSSASGAAIVILVALGAFFLWWFSKG